MTSQNEIYADRSSVTSFEVKILFLRKQNIAAKNGQS